MARKKPSSFSLKNLSSFFFFLSVLGLFVWGRGGFFSNHKRDRAALAAQAKADGLCVTNTSEICVFPFTYEDITYSTCAQVSGKESWCATKVDESGSMEAPFFFWGFCDPEICPTEINTPKGYMGRETNQLCPDCTDAPTRAPTMKAPEFEYRFPDVEGKGLVKTEDKCVTTEAAKCSFPWKVDGKEIKGCVGGFCNTEDGKQAKCDTKVCPAWCSYFGCTCQGLSQCREVHHMKSYGKADATEKAFWGHNACKTKPDEKFKTCEDYVKSLKDL